jgi:mannose-6-phosphate isomerase-like protein (cupin superfamily)
MVGERSEVEYRVERFSGDSPPDSVEMNRRMKAEGYDVFEWTDGPQTVYEPHQHSEDQSHCVVSGELELTIDGFGTVVLKAGDRDFMPAGTRHSARVLGDREVRYLIGVKYK